MPEEATLSEESLKQSEGAEVQTHQSELAADDQVALEEGSEGVKSVDGDRQDGQIEMPFNVSMRPDQHDIFADNTEVTQKNNQLD